MLFAIWDPMVASLPVYWSRYGYQHPVLLIFWPPVRGKFIRSAKRQWLRVPMESRNLTFQAFQPIFITWWSAASVILEFRKRTFHGQLNSSLSIHSLWRWNLFELWNLNAPVDVNTCILSAKVTSWVSFPSTSALSLSGRERSQGWGSIKGDRVPYYRL